MTTYALAFLSHAKLGSTWNYKQTKTITPSLLVPVKLISTEILEDLNLSSFNVNWKINRKVVIKNKYSKLSLLIDKIKSTTIVKCMNELSFT